MHYRGYAGVVDVLHCLSRAIHLLKEVVSRRRERGEGEEGG